jgi:hypothetical protein
VFSFTGENLKWASLLFFILISSAIPAAISALAAEERAHGTEKTVNDCVISAQFGLIGFYGAILVAAELEETVKNILLSLLLLVVGLGIIQLFFFRSTEKRLQKVQAHACVPGCAVDLHFKGKWAIFGSNSIICGLSVCVAACIAFSPLVVRKAI